MITRMSDARLCVEAEALPGCGRSGAGYQIPPHLVHRNLALLVRLIADDVARRRVVADPELTIRSTSDSAANFLGPSPDDLREVPANLPRGALEPALIVVLRLFRPLADDEGRGLLLPVADE